MVEPESAEGAGGRHPHVFRPIQVGTLSLDHRLVVPPHGGGNGSLLGNAGEFEQHAALWLAKLAGGMRWLGGGPNFVRNPLPPDSSPPAWARTGRASSATRAIRTASAGARRGCMPVVVCCRCRWSSGRDADRPVGDPVELADHRIPHALDIDEVRWLVREYGESAAVAIDAGVDAIEVHANHDDLVQWFLSATQGGRRVRRHGRGAAPVPA